MALPSERDCQMAGGVFQVFASLPDGGSQLFLLARTIADAREEGRQAGTNNTVSQVLTILDEEGWLGSARARIEKLLPCP